MANELILVDEDDREIGFDEKISTHRNGSLHRAFSVFLFDESTGKLLLQKRNTRKYHSGGLWSNSCCSHQYKGESMLQSVERCMKDELGIMPGQCISVNEVGKFTYYSDYGELKEHEIDHVFVCHMDVGAGNSLNPDMEEVEEVKWIDPDEVRQLLDSSPETFTSWFAKAYAIGVSPM